MTKILQDCYIAAREGEVLMWDDESGEVHFNLTGYAIVPLEDYNSANHRRNAANIAGRLLPESLR